MQLRGTGIWSHNMSHILRARLPEGTAFILRPVQPEDTLALQALVEGLPYRDLRWRFHGAVKGVSGERLLRMTQVDPLREVALVGSLEAQGGSCLVADARFVVDEDDGDSAEFALMVSEAWRRLGVGALALVALQHAAAQRGLHWLHGSVCADNTPMLALLQHCGFRCHPHRGDRRLVVAEIGLHPPEPPGHPAGTSPPARWWQRPFTSPRHHR
jgi:acetyltransferase